MPIEDLEFGRFESLVLARLDTLKEMGLEIKDCQKALKIEQALLSGRISRLEHQETRLLAYLTVIAFVVGIAVKLLLK